MGSCNFVNSAVLIINVSAYQPGGRAPISSTNKKLDGKGYLPSGKELADHSKPRALKTEEIPTVVNDFRLAARNAIAAGMLLSIQFLSDICRCL